MAFRRGYSAELELVELLRRQDFFAVRVPISGGRGFPCDVLAAKGEDRRAYEVKVTKEKAIYLYEKDFKGLIEFCQSFGFQAYIAIRWKHARKKPWTFKQIDEAKPLKITKK